MKGKIILLGGMAGLIFASVYYYIALPAINIHATGFWSFIITLLAVALGVCLVRANRGSVTVRGQQIYLNEINLSTPAKIVGGLLIAVVAFYLVGSLLGSPIINADKYQQLLTIEEKNFADDVKEVDYDTIPILDKTTARLLGDRKMGSMVDFVSQFEAGSDYTQINYRGTPVRVTPLEYASTIKWLTNQADGIPAYITIDMTTQDTEVVMLEEGIKYSKSELFNRNIYRHLRFNYPTYIFDEQIFFELDEEGTPYWVCPVKKFNIGLFGGQTVGNVVTVNAVTGECADYSVDELPDWVDKVYRAELLVNLYDYSGLYVNGFLNSVLSQKGCLQTTNDYNYLVMDNDLWVYTGVTSLGADQSNVGFVLMNQRTMETRYYVVEGAIEDSAMQSAEGQVQNLGYNATFPLLINIGGEPTYFMALKDYSGLVKMYAMVNVSKYQLVATGDTVKACDENYRTLLSENGIEDVLNTEPDDDIDTDNTSKEPVVKPENMEILEKTGVILDSYTLIVDGDTHVYLFLEDSEEIFAVNLTEAELVGARNYKSGDHVKISYEDSVDAVKKVVDITLNS